MGILTAGRLHPGGFWAVSSPVGMTALHGRVSRAALLEPSLNETKSGYAELVRTTGPFLPWFPALTSMTRRRVRPRAALE